MAERPYLSHYAARDNRSVAKTMERGVKLVISVYDEVQRRLSSLHRHGSGGGGRPRVVIV